MRKQYRALVFLRMKQIGEVTFNAIFIEVILNAIVVVLHTIGLLSSVLWINPFILGLSSILAILGAWGLMSVGESGVQRFGTPAEEYSKMVSQRLSQPIPANHGKDFEAVAEALRDERVEFSVVLSPSGRKLTEWTLLDVEKVCLSAEWNEKLCYEMRGMTHLHNHPDLAESSFSGNDFAFMVDHYLKQTIVVTLHRTYIIENPNYNSMNCSGWKVKRYTERVLKSGLFQLSCKIASRTKFCAPVRWLSIWTSYRTAKKFGFKFSMQDVRAEKLKRLVRKIGVRKVKFAIATAIVLGFFCSLPLVTEYEDEATREIYYELAISASEKGFVEEYATCDTKDPAKDPAMQGNAPVGGGVNYGE